MRKLFKIMAIWFILTIPFGMLGCGSSKTQIKQQNITLGQELQDLEDAYKNELLSEKEFKKIRKELIENYTD
jgi:hypothetical protein